MEEPIGGEDHIEECGENGKLQPLDSALEQFEKVGIDALGLFRISRVVKERLFGFTDYTTKYAVARPVGKDNCEEIGNMLMEDDILVNEGPQSISYDRGKSFRTSLMRAIYYKFNMRHVITTAYQPQTNGQIKRTSNMKKEESVVKRTNFDRKGGKISKKLATVH